MRPDETNQLTKLQGSIKDIKNLNGLYKTEVNVLDYKHLVFGVWGQTHIGGVMLQHYHVQSVVVDV